MKKEQNTISINFKVTPSLKKAVAKKLQSNSQTEAEYMRNLIRQDLNLK